MTASLTRLCGRRNGAASTKRLLDIQKLTETFKRIDEKEVIGPKVFVSPLWLNKLIRNKKEPFPYRIVESSWNVGEEYLKAHIPEAIHIDTNDIESEANNWNIFSGSTIERVLTENGITTDTLTIVYSNDINAAARLAYVMIWAGVKDVRVLNGGFEAWQSMGFECRKGAVKPESVFSFGAQVPVHPEFLMVEPKEVLAAQLNDNFRLVSIRCWDEFTGRTSGYNYIKGAGEPKGAVWGHAVIDSIHIEGHLDADGIVKDIEKMIPLWKDWDIRQENDIAFYCGTGWRASLSWLMAYEAGWKNIKVFDGGWYMWEKDSSLPVQIGNPREENRLKGRQKFEVSKLSRMCQNPRK